MHTVPRTHLKTDDHRVGNDRHRVDEGTWTGPRRQEQGGDGEAASERVERAQAEAEARRRPLLAHERDLGQVARDDQDAAERGAQHVGDPGGRVAEEVHQPQHAQGRGGRRRHAQRHQGRARCRGPG